MEDLLKNRERWASLAIAALLPLVLTWFVCILITSIIYALTASAPALGDIGWSDSLHFGTSFWLVSVGATLRIGTARMALIPLTLTAVTWWLSVRGAKRSLISSWEDVAVYTAVSAIFTALLGFIDLEGTFLISAVVGAAILGFSASIFAWWGSEPAPLSWWHYLQRGWRLARPLLIGAFACASLAFLVAIVVSFKRVGALYSAYEAHWAGNIGITFVQLLYLPLFIIWALSFISGSPIHIGSGTSFSPFVTSPAPLPGIPFFGTIPSASVPLYFLPLMLLLVGIVAPWWALRPRKNSDDDSLYADDAESVEIYGVGEAGNTFEIPQNWREYWRDIGLSLAIVFLVLACAGALASGALGSGRMYEVGVNAPLFALLATIELGGGLCVFLGLRMWKEKRRSHTDVSDDEPADTHNDTQGDAPAVVQGD